ncbi:MAG: hypothetical protein U1C46_01020 [Bacteroidales bacterium]|nr:hypothetical protein [Bacteroidales bacterium]MDZ4203372.1 hypothetical protein [Bacteroidales bacterium]
MTTFLIVILVLYLLSRFIFPVVVPRLLRYLFNRQQRQQAGYKGHQTHAKPEGEISIDYVPKQKKTTHVPDNQGEYIEFEEVKKNDKIINYNDEPIH